MTQTPTTHAFKSDARQLLDIVINSLYSAREVFLRELISNSCDAMDKRRFHAVTNPELAPEDEYTVEIELDPEQRTISVTDNGIGMSADEIVDNLGTIARSGTKRFVEELLAKGQASSAEDLIGQFGVGFYSTFMVADRVSVLSRAPGQEQGVLWECKGGETFEVSDAPRAQIGTTVTLHLKPADEEAGIDDFTGALTIRRVVKRYSDYVGYPVKLKSLVEGAVAWEKLNTGKAIWLRPAAEVTAEEHESFYKTLAIDWQPPLHTIGFTAEGNLEFHVLLYVPKAPPLSLFRPGDEHGLQLYVNKVRIKERAPELLPRYLRFLRGVVECSDLPLNVSREIVQVDGRLETIRRHITKKVLDDLGSLIEKDRAKYEELYKVYARVLKEGVGEDRDNLDRQKKLLLFESTSDRAKPTTLGEYKARMKEGQKAIYYALNPTVDGRPVDTAPHLESFLQAGLEVLLLSDPVDELLVSALGTFEDLPLTSVAQGEPDLGDDEDKEAREARREEARAKLQPLMDGIRAALQERVSEVRLSARLVSSPVCLVSQEGELSPTLARLLRRAGEEDKQPKRVLELNAEHPLILGLADLAATKPGADALDDMAWLLYGRALIAEGALPEDLSAFGKRLDWLMSTGLTGLQG